MEMEIKEPVKLVIDKVESWIDGFISMVPNMLVAILIFVVFLVLAKFGSRFSTKLLSKTSDRSALVGLLSTTVYGVILGLGLFIILGILGLEKAVTSLLAGVGVVGLALGFAFQDIASNFVSGVILAFRRPFMIGDIIKVNQVSGKVLKTTLRATVLESFEGQEVFIPNKELLQGNIHNYTSLGHRQIVIACGVSYSEDLEQVEEIVRNAVARLDGIIRKDEMVFDYEEFAGSSINFNVRFWIEYPGEPGYLAMRSKAVKAIKNALDSDNIVIPFPITTLDFNIKGGKDLSEMLISESLDQNGKNN